MLADLGAGGAAAAGALLKGARDRLCAPRWRSCVIPARAFACHARARPGSTSRQLAGPNCVELQHTLQFALASTKFNAFQCNHSSSISISISFLILFSISISISERATHFEQARERLQQLAATAALPLFGQRWPIFARQPVPLENFEAISLSRLARFGTCSALARARSSLKCRGALACCVRSSRSARRSEFPFVPARASIKRRPKADLRAKGRAAFRLHHTAHRQQRDS